MVPRLVTVPLLTAADGSQTTYADAVAGRILGIIYVKPGSGGFDNGSTITVTDETTGQAVWAESNVNASATRYPRVGVCGATGTALTYDGTRTINEPAVIVGRIKIVIASGGNAKTGTLYFIIG